MAPKIELPSIPATRGGRVRRRERISLIGRADPKAVAEAREKLLLDDLLPKLLDAIPEYALVLNRQRQILAVNSRLSRDLGCEDPATFVGRRPGEFLSCIRSEDGPDGCGTGPHCRVCGAVTALTESLEQETVSRHECRLTRRDIPGSALDLEVQASPLSVAGTDLTLLTLRDISAEKRRNILEKVFFHDILNTAGGIKGLAAALKGHRELSAGDKQTYTDWLGVLADRLHEEIVHQQRLIAAEEGSFKPDLAIVPIPELVRELVQLYRSHELAADCTIDLEPLPELTIISDPAILRRILGNLLKNAIEATPPSGRISVGVREADDGAEFSVRNPGVMAPEVQSQVFQRSFSTKGGSGRGIGTYSVRLFTERYLKGKVSFTSREPEGTVFRLLVPRGY